ncbi:MAG: hypothetical protein ACYTEQ_01335 [Planctomycetota bacterium]|jgi:hypothetical protein
MKKEDLSDNFISGGIMIALLLVVVALTIRACGEDWEAELKGDAKIPYTTNPLTYRDDTIDAVASWDELTTTTRWLSVYGLRQAQKAVETLDEGSQFEALYSQESLRPAIHRVGVEFWLRAEANALTEYNRVKAKRIRFQDLTTSYTLKGG